MPELDFKPTDIPGIDEAYYNLNKFYRYKCRVFTSLKGAVLGMGEDN
jgi:hypothetical protein